MRRVVNHRIFLTNLSLTAAASRHSGGTNDFLLPVDVSTGDWKTTAELVETLTAEEFESTLESLSPFGVEISDLLDKVDTEFFIIATANGGLEIGALLANTVAAFVEVSAEGDAAGEVARAGKFEAHHERAGSVVLFADAAAAHDNCDTIVGIVNGAVSVTDGRCGEFLDDRLHGGAK